MHKVIMFIKMIIKQKTLLFSGGEWRGRRRMRKMKQRKSSSAPHLILVCHSGGISTSQPLLLIGSVLTLEFYEIFIKLHIVLNIHIYIFPMTQMKAKLSRK